MFQVSVIIPVFNASHFVREAVESALEQPEVGEVILVEDGSKDNSLDICEKLSRDFGKVRLLTHSHGTNRGVCASRNFGIQSALFEVIAFLDADDWYLPNRFAKERAIFENPEVMAVYSISAIQFQDGREELFGCREDLLVKLGTNELRKVYCHIMSNDIVLGHTNANTFRKSVFDQVGYFDERLKLHEDTELWNRLARSFLFHAGELRRPVSVARRHNNNSIYARSTDSQRYYLSIWIDNIGLKNLYPCEKENFIYLYSRAISCRVRPHWLRKLVLHSSIYGLGFFAELFIQRFHRSFRHNMPNA